MKLAITFSPRDPSGPRCVLAPPRPLRDARGRLFVDDVADLGSCVALAAAGRPEDASGAGVVVCSIHRVGDRTPWAVHVHALRGARWEELPDVRLLASISRGVVAHRLTSRAGAEYVVSLFRDERAEPWPEPWPFVVPALAPPTDPRPPLPRRFMVDGGAARDDVDDWMLQRMRDGGARHAQLAVVRGDRVTLARAYSFAEPGYPVATLDDALRLGSVSKAITTIALLGAMRDGRLDASALDERIAPLLGLEPDAAPGVTLRDLLLHRSGLRSFPDLSPTDADNPLSESNVAASVGRPRARPGDLRELLARTGGGPLRSAERAPYAYSNEGFTLVGEIAAQLLGGSCDALERVLVDLFERAGVDTRGRGVLAPATHEAARARVESPAHGASPTVRRATFASRPDEAGPLVDGASFVNLRFLGAAAGVSVPVVWVARVLARLHGDLAGVLAPCLEDARAGARETYGLFVGAPGWVTERSEDGGARTVCLHHNGRVEGGAALLMLRAPLEPHPDHVPMSVLVAMNQLGDLYEDPHGRELFGILRRLDPANRSRT